MHQWDVNLLKNNLQVLTFVTAFDGSCWFWSKWKNSNSNYFNINYSNSIILLFRLVFSCEYRNSAFRRSYCSESIFFVFCFFNFCSFNCLLWGLGFKFHSGCELSCRQLGFVTNSSLEFQVNLLKLELKMVEKEYNQFNF